MSERQQSIRKLASLRSKIQGLAHEQEKLSEAREQLLIKREDRLEIAKRVREQRIRTANAEVVFMKVVRTTLHEFGITIPKTLASAYSTIEEEDSKLRVWEEQLLEAEQSLTGEEWIFLEMENDFYQFELPEMLSEEDESEVETTKMPNQWQPWSYEVTPISPSAQVKYQAEVCQYDRLHDRFEALRMQERVRLETFTQPYKDVIQEIDFIEPAAQSSADILLDRISNCEVRLQALKLEMNQSEYPFEWRGRPYSEADLSLECHVPIARSSQAYSEGSIQNVNDWVTNRRIIQEWSLDCLKRSAIEKMQYLNIVQSVLGPKQLGTLDTTAWRSRATTSWGEDSSHFRAHGTDDRPAVPTAANEDVELASNITTTESNFHDTEIRHELQPSGKRTGTHTLYTHHHTPFACNDSPVTPEFRIEVSANDEIRESNSTVKLLPDSVRPHTLEQSLNDTDSGVQRNCEENRACNTDRNHLEAPHSSRSHNTSPRCDSAQDSHANDCVKPDK